GEMQRSRVAGDHACGTAQERHQFAEIAAVNERAGVDAGVKQRRRQIVVARPCVDDAAQPQRLAQVATQRSEALGGPAFGTPPAPWAQDNIAIQSLLAQPGTRRGLVFLRNLQAYGSGATLRTGTQR